MGPIKLAAPALCWQTNEHLILHLPLKHTKKRTSVLTGKVPPAMTFFFLLQYIYETNENNDKVVLGKGTYGVVYAGRDLSNQVRIAIKEIPEKDSTYEGKTHMTFFILSRICQ